MGELEDVVVELESIVSDMTELAGSECDCESSCGCTDQCTRTCSWREYGR